MNLRPGFALEEMQTRFMQDRGVMPHVLMTLFLAACGPAVELPPGQDGTVTGDGQDSSDDGDTPADSAGDSSTGGGPQSCASDEDCPPQHRCLADECFAGPLPELQIVSPKREAAIAVAGDQATVPVSVTVTGQHLVLVDPDATAQPGSGYVVVELDDEPVAELTEGDLELGVTVEVSASPTPGAHRLTASARLSNDVAYDNPEARARQFFWLDDGAPHVGFIRPFPGDVFPLEATEVEIEVAAINFSLVPTQPGAIPDGDAEGHVHVHLDSSFPGCVFETVCDNGYLNSIAPQDTATSTIATITLPAAAEGPATVTAVLRQVNHFNYLYPDLQGDPVWEDITIDRSPI